MVMLDAAENIKDLQMPPGNALEKLKGNLIGFWSIRVNQQFRIVFNWVNNDAFNVRIIDYH